MGNIEIRDMLPADEYYVGTCTHVDESPEADACGERRAAWLRERYARGVRAKVALLDGKQVGFLYAMPIEICPWGPLGRDLLAIPCLFVQPKAAGKGVGQALIQAAEAEAQRQGQKGLVTTAYYHDFWFMPARFFERAGFSVARRRHAAEMTEGEQEYFYDEVILWKAFDASAAPPEFLVRDYGYEPVPDKVVVDLFWNAFCQTSNIEAQRVREVASEFGDAVVLREYPADDREVLCRYQTPRGIFVNGREIGWGYEAPREGIREAIVQALAIAPAMGDVSG